MGLGPVLKFRPIRKSKNGNFEFGMFVGNDVFSHGFIPKFPMSSYLDQLRHVYDH